MTVAGRPTPNTGIYATVVDKEIKSKKSYKYFSLLINSCLGLQILVAAALTALGASNGSHATVTVFGAINTAIAGFLTYLNGSGLPNRLKYFQHEWGKVSRASAKSQLVSDLRDVKAQLFGCNGLIRTLGVIAVAAEEHAPALTSNISCCFEAHAFPA